MLLHRKRKTTLTQPNPIPSPVTFHSTITNLQMDDKTI